MVSGSAPTVGYWYDDDHGDDTDPQRALEALRAYRASELAMRKRIRDDMEMNETDLAALRFAVRAKSRAEPVTPTDLMNHLGVTMASVTVMIDRLERSGHLRREMNPNDRRSRLVSSTDLADSEVRATLDLMYAGMTGAAEGLSVEEADAVVAFLGRMQRAMDGILPVG